MKLVIGMVLGLVPLNGWADLTLLHSDGTASVLYREGNLVRKTDCGKFPSGKADRTCSLDRSFWMNADEYRRNVNALSRIEAKYSGIDGLIGLSQRIASLEETLNDPLISASEKEAGHKHLKGLKDIQAKLLKLDEQIFQRLELGKDQSLDANFQDQYFYAYYGMIPAAFDANSGKVFRLAPEATVNRHWRFEQKLRARQALCGYHWRIAVLNDLCYYYDGGSLLPDRLPIAPIKQLVGNNYIEINSVGGFVLSANSFRHVGLSGGVDNAMCVWEPDPTNTIKPEDLFSLATKNCPAAK